ncbi:hypothetical protein [Pseudoclavibacter terrae]|uniref:Uncharacterized protein n=1 Tax=Pseudoclavibacter terrae TaxID=1530195 RepID=A0A7J5B2M3_9MICO|nr:hypothetical protein [Pseudoclavibacter terrae]KAB1638260.1 hypothetical protein F8O03_07625 [Pseudoclavibacter terrae]
MGVLVHPDRQPRFAVRSAVADGRLRVIADHRGGNPWLFARPADRELTEVRTRHLDLVILSRLQGETATAVVLLAQGRRSLGELSDLSSLLADDAVIIAKDAQGAVRVEGPRAGGRRASWVEVGSAVFASDDRALLAEVFRPNVESDGDRGRVVIRAIPTGMWLHTVDGVAPRLRSSVTV